LATVVTQNLWLWLVCIGFVGMLVVQWWLRERSLADTLNRLPVVIRALLLAVALLLIVLSQGNSDAFIYFQF